MIAGIPLSLLTAVYTAYLFAQAKARDLWQNPLLPPHLVLQALVLGALVLAPFASLWTNPERQMSRVFPRMPEITPLLWIIMAGTVVHLLMIWGEVSLTHGSAHARVATWEMTRGRYRSYFRLGVMLPLFGMAGLIVAGTMTFVTPIFITFFVSLFMLLIGMMLYEHAYVQAGQSVPLA
jgi:Ni/Fe-hydrogenase subunit HybB-like protein